MFYEGCCPSTTEPPTYPVDLFHKVMFGSSLTFSEDVVCAKQDVHVFAEMLKGWFIKKN